MSVSTETPIRSALLAECSPLLQPIVADFSRAILGGKLGAGAKLPPLRKLARKYSISFSAARVAMNQLEKAGLVELHQGSGTYVRRSRASVPTQSSAAVGLAYLFLDNRPHVIGNIGPELVTSLRRQNIVAMQMGLGGEIDGAELESLLPDIGRAPRAIVVQGASPQRDRAIDVFASRIGARVISTIRLSHPQPASWHSVEPDIYSAYQMAAERLMAMGHRRIGIVTKSRKIEFDPATRQAGLRRTQQILGAGHAMRRAEIHGGLSIHYNLPVDTDPSGIPVDEPNIKRMTRWLQSDNRPTAIITDDYRVAGVRRAAREATLRVPDDLLILGVGGTFLVDTCDGPCISLRYELIARQIAELIATDDEQLGGAVRHIVIPPVFVEH